MDCSADAKAESARMAVMSRSEMRSVVNVCCVCVCVGAIAGVVAGVCVGGTISLCNPTPPRTLPSQVQQCNGSTFAALPDVGQGWKANRGAMITQHVWGASL